MPTRRRSGYPHKRGEPWQIRQASPVPGQDLRPPWQAWWWALRRDCQPQATAGITSRRSSFARLARLFVLKLDLASGACFETHQNAADISLLDTEDHGLLAAVVVGISDGEEVLSL